MRLKSLFAVGLVALASAVPAGAYSARAHHARQALKRWESHYLAIPKRDVHVRCHRRPHHPANCTSRMCASWFASIEGRPFPFKTWATLDAHVFRRHGRWIIRPYAGTLTNTRCR